MTLTAVSFVHAIDQDEEVPLSGGLDFEPGVASLISTLLTRPYLKLIVTSGLEITVLY